MSRSPVSRCFFSFLFLFFAGVFNTLTVERSISEMGNYNYFVTRYMGRRRRRRNLWRTKVVRMVVCNELLENVGGHSVRKALEFKIGNFSIGMQSLNSMDCSNFQKSLCSFRKLRSRNLRQFVLIRLIVLVLNSD